MLKRLVGYAAYMFGANTLTGLLTFGVSAMGMVTRPKEAFGDYALYMRIYEIGQGLFIFGANASIQRFAADDLQNRARYSKLALQVFLLLLLVCAALGAGVGFSISWSYALALFGLPWLVLYWWGRYIVRSNLDAKREARLMMIASLANSIYQFVFLTFTDYRDALIYGDFLALVTSGVAGMIYISGGLGTSLRAIWRTHVPKSFIRESVKFAVPLWMSGQIFQARHQAQGIYTAAALGAAPLGALQGMQTMWQFTLKPLEYLSSAALPGLVTAKEERSKLYRELMRLCIVAFTIIGLAVACGIPLVFELIDGIAKLLGRQGEPLVVKYWEVPTLLRVVALSMPAVAFEVVNNQYSVAEGKQRTVLYSNVVTVVAVLGSLYPLAVQFGVIGVVVSGVIGVFSGAITYAIVLWKHAPRDIRTGVVWAAIATACTLAAMIPVQLEHEWRYSWVLTFPALAVYVIGMFIFRLIEVEDLRRVRRAIFERAA
jgi:O-antigen/teichoic acid export membrane protein